MDLLTFRIIGHPIIPDTTWLKVGRGINVLRTDHRSGAGGLLRILQSINPPYDLEQIRPFADLPSHTASPQYIKKIIPAKKTAALAIYTASPQLVSELSAIDAAFYETDRIEFGRRRDFSRWINFVELSGSTRWSEIEPTVRLIHSRLKPDASVAAGLQTTMDSLRGVDRLKDERAARLKGLLQEMRPGLLEKDQPLLDQCLLALDRDRHFQQAKEVVASRLPLFLFISGTGTDGLDLVMPLGAPGQPQGAQAQLPPAEKLQTVLAAQLSLHGERYGCPPIFLLDFSALKLEHHEQAALLETLLGHASRLQCLVAPSDLFLKLCTDLGHQAEKGAQPLLTVIDVPGGTSPK